MTPAQQRLRGTALVVAAAFLFAVMAVVARTLAGVMSAGQQVFLRFVIGLLGVSPVFLARRQLPRVGQPLLWILRGVFGGAAVYLYFVAIERLGVGPATLLNYSAPLYAALFSVLFLKERPTRHLSAGLVFASVGAGLVAWSTADPAHPFVLGAGAWAGLFSAVLSGAALTTIRGLRQAEGGGQVDASSIFVSFTFFGALMAVPFAAARWTPLNGRLLLAALAIGVLSLAAQLLFTHAFAYVTAVAGSATLQLTPAFSWLMAIVFLGEGIRPLALFGAVLSVSGVLWGAGLGDRLWPLGEPP